LKTVESFSITVFHLSLPSIMIQQFPAGVFPCVVLNNCDTFDALLEQEYRSSSNRTKRTTIHWSTCKW